MFNQFNLNENDHKIIPFSWFPTRFYVMTFEGWSGFSIDVNDVELDIAMQLASETLHSFINIYKSTHAFTQPEFCIKPNGTFLLRIGTMENDRYNYLKNKQQHDLSVTAPSGTVTTLKELIDEN